MRVAKVKESEIQKQILVYLELKGYTVWRNHMGGVIRGRRLTKNPNSGMPDILGICKKSAGRLFAIEVKTKSGVVADNQKEWIKILKDAGCLAFVARDLETVVSTMEVLDV